VPNALGVRREGVTHETGAVHLRLDESPWERVEVHREDARACGEQHGGTPVGHTPRFVRTLHQRLDICALLRGAAIAPLCGGGAR
jgi:hypothetical protein